MSALPFIQPPRARSDNAALPSPERRIAEGSKDRFADSLANARTDRAARTPDRAAGCLSPHTDDADRAADSSSDLEDGKVARARAAAQQRAQVQALMLSGAMKFAGTRNDAAPTPTLADSASPPTTGDAAQTSAFNADPAALLATSAPAAPAGSAPSQVSLPAPALAAPAPVLAIALPIAATLQSMPAATVINDTTNVDESAPATDPLASATDLSATTAATASAAALQLVAALPINGTVATPEPTSPDATATAATTSQTDRSSSPLNATLSSRPAATDTTLVEDHFDAPSSTLSAANATGEVAAITVASTEPQPVATSGTTHSDALSATPAAKPASGTGGIDLTALQNEIAKLAPEFRERLERVIDRMKREFGHAVRVIETLRSQSRQDALFAQGRTAPGAVVTWTKNSKHGKGLAADLLVDGQWQNPEGYAHLADIAKQEGLRTLGARDPGHVEMTGDGAVSGETLGALLSDLQGDAGDSARQLRANVSRESRAQSQSRNAAMAQVSNVAQVARVSSVAKVAEVARVAAVARPGESAPQTAQPAEAFTPLAVSPVSAASGGSDATSTLRVATPVSSVNLADRISHLMDLQATQDAKPLNSVLLRMDNANGIEDQIRIDTRGTSVDARLGLGDAQQAAQLTDRLGELRDALERRGLTADGVRVQAATGTRSTEGVTATRTIAATIELAAMRAAADSQAHGNTRDQSARDQAQREAFARDQSRNTPRPSSDDARQRSRREQPEERR